MVIASGDVAKAEEGTIAVWRDFLFPLVIKPKQFQFGFGRKFRPVSVSFSVFWFSSFFGVSAETLFLAEIPRNTTFQ